MLTKAPTKEMVREWKAVYEEYRPLLKPNKKTAAEVIRYLREKYPAEEIDTDKARQVVIGNVMSNKPLFDKLAAGKKVRPVVFFVPNRSGAARLYEHREEVFKDAGIFVFLDLETAYAGVEGSGELADELVAFQGLDEADLGNFYLVANYVRCLKKYGLLQSVPEK